MQRDRSLQNSMFLQSTNYINKHTLRQYNFPIPNIKRMNSITQPTNTIQSINQLQNITNQQQNKQILYKNNHIQLENQNFIKCNDNALHEICQKIDKLNKIVDKHEILFNSFGSEDQFMKKIVNQNKKNMGDHCANNDVYEQINFYKLEIKQLQQQIIKIPKINQIEQLITKKMQNANKLPQNISNTNLINYSIPKPTYQMDPLLSQILKKRDDYFQNILIKIQTQIEILKKNLTNITPQMKVSPIQSNSCIMLKYQQLFKSRNRLQMDIILNQCNLFNQQIIYYIDNQGYLLDCYSRYIIDQRGKKIKLEDKHIYLLKLQKILF